MSDDAENGPPQDPGAAPRLLVVGNLRSWRRAGRALPQLEGCDFVGFAGLDAQVLERVRPDVVLSALVGEDFDALDLARRLAELGFRGRYRALAMDLRHPGTVLAELRAAAPGLDLDLLLIDEEGGAPPG